MLLTACSSEESASSAPADSHTVAIVTSLKPLALLIEEAYGEQVEVSYLVPPEQSPHHVTLRPSAVNRLKEADLLVWAGPELETFLPGLLERFGFRSAVTSTATEASPADASGQRRLELAALEVLPDNLLLGYSDKALASEDESPGEPGTHMHTAGSVDPHFWLSIGATEELLVQLEPVITRMHGDKSTATPEQQQQFQAQLAAGRSSLLKQLKADDVAKGSDIVANFPLIYSYHPAFNYLLQELGIPDEGYLTRHPESGAPPSAISAFLKTATEHEVCMLVEPQFKQPVGRLLAKLGEGGQLRSRQVVADPLGVEAMSFSDLYRGLRQALRTCLGARALEAGQ